VTMGISASLAAQERRGHFLGPGGSRRQHAIRAYGLPDGLAMPSGRKRVHHSTPMLARMLSLFECRNGSKSSKR
jgi:hypothetical protein